MSDAGDDTGLPPLAGDRADDDALWAIFSGSRNPMLLADDDRRYVNANAAACELLGYDLAALRTLRIDDIALPENRPFMDEVWRDFLDRGGSIGRFGIVRSDGTSVEVEFSATARVAPGLHLTILLNPLLADDPPAPDGAEAGKRSLDEPVPAVASHTGNVLTASERRVMTLLALGHNWHEVADETGTSPADVRDAMQSAMDKLGGRTRAHAVSIAIRAGEIDPSDPSLA